MSDQQTSNSLDEAMSRFRTISRELFNSCFRVPDLEDQDGWTLCERFAEIEQLLFRSLVALPENLHGAEYGIAVPEIRTVLRHGGSAPIMLNREINSGYWDFPIAEVPEQAHLCFVRFFDWDLRGVRDNQYVEIRVEKWEAHPEANGKHGLLEARHVAFAENGEV